MNKTIAAAAVVSLAAMGHAQVTRSGQGYLLRAKYTKGQVIRLNSSNTVNGVPGAAAGMKVSLPITMTVLNVDKGVALIQLKLGGAKLNNNTVINQGQTATVRLDMRNQPAGGNVPSGASVVFPSTPVKVGQTWTAQAPFSTGLGNQGTLKATYRFQGVKTVGGRGVAVITYSVSGSASGSGSLTVLTKDGTLNSNQLQLKMNLEGQAPVSISSNLTRA